MNPTKTIQQLVQNNWDVSKTSMASAPVFQREQYSREQTLPAITFTRKHERVLPSTETVTETETGFTARHGPTGKQMQRRSGFVLTDCVAGTVSDCQGIGTSGGDLDPKLVRQELQQQAQQIVLDTQRTAEFDSLAPDSAEDTIDQPDSTTAPVFRHRFQARFTYDKLPNP